MTRHCTPHLNGKNSFIIFNWNSLPKIKVKDKLKACPNFLANYNWLYYSKSTGKKCSAPLLFRCRFSVLVRKKADREVFVVLSIVSLSSLPILGNPVPSCLKKQKSINIFKERFEDSEQRTKLFGKVSISSWFKFFLIVDIRCQYPCMICSRDYLKRKRDI